MINGSITIFQIKQYYTAAGKNVNLIFTFLSVNFTG